MTRFPDAFVALRTCYRHPAGEVGVALAAVLEQRGWMARVAVSGWPLGGYRLTARGAEQLASLGLALDALSPQLVHKACPDNTQRLPDGAWGVPHIGGRLGAALTDWLLASGAAERLPHPQTVYEARTLVLTPAGRARLRTSGLLGDPAGDEGAPWTGARVG